MGPANVGPMNVMSAETETPTEAQYRAGVKINQYETGEETIHAVNVLDPTKVDNSFRDPSYTARCGTKYLRIRGNGTFESWHSGWRAVCTRCEVLIAKDNETTFPRAVKAIWEDAREGDRPDVALLRRFLITLPRGHHDRAGVIRAIEVLQAYGPKENTDI